MRRGLALWAMAACLACVAAARGAEKGASSMDVIRERLLAEWRGGKVNLAAVRGLIASQRADGTWADVDYADKTRGGWKPGTHLSRMTEMAVALRAEGSDLKGDAGLLKSVRASLDVWLARDPRGDNWWNNEIGTPFAVGQTALLLGADLTPVEKAGVVKILDRSKIGMTGQNLVWLARNNVIRGCLEGDGARVREALARVWKEVRDDLPEGIQADASFHQHGAQLYTGGYGSGFLDDTTRMFALAAGTDAAAPAEKVKLVERYFLDGYQWMVCGPVMEPMARGREISRPEGDRRAGMRAAAERLLAVTGATGPRAEELRAAMARAEKAADAPALVGNRMYWRSDLMVQRRAGWYASVKMVSRRTLGTETGNGENHRGHGALFGTLMVMRTGEEYRNIAPLWDWTRLPGATIEAIEKWPAHQWGKGAEGATAFVGGVSDGTCGAVAFDLDREGVKARKFVAMGDKVIVALGAGVAGGGKLPLRTSIEQRWLKGMVMVKGEEGLVTMKDESRVAGGVTWVMHDQIGYVPLLPGKVVVENSVRRGRWRDINNNGSAEEISRGVLSVWIEHGAGEGTYGYAIVPETRPDEIERAVAGVQIIGNTRDVQAVIAGGMTAAAFYAARGVGASEGRIEVDRPCVVLVRDGKVWVADPEQRGGAVAVRVGAKRLRAELKGGASGEAR